MNTVPVSAAGYLALQHELQDRIRDRVGLAQRIQAAIADEPNLIENSEYQAVQAQREANEARISELEDKIARAEVIDVSRGFGDKVKFGATVTLMNEDTGEKKVWQIVGEPEADARKGKISVTSPTARALIGQTKGAVVEVEAPAGTKVYKISQVRWPADGLKRRKGLVMSGQRAAKQRAEPNAAQRHGERDA
jgi:transcription elongation factor GreA